MAERIYTDDMDEISGFGGGYEAAARAMVLAALAWWDEHPTADPRWRSYENVTGICTDENADAKAIDAAMIAAVADKGGATGAMHQAAVSHALYAHKNGWPKYQAYLRERKRAEATGAAS